MGNNRIIKIGSPDGDYKKLLCHNFGSHISICLAGLRKSAETKPRLELGTYFRNAITSVIAE
jgi:hypothetical protein